MAQVALHDVRKVYPGDILAVKNVNLTINDHEFLVLVGPSGCGKSTLLRMIAGLEEITSGTIEIGDRMVNTVPPKDRDIAMVFQNYALYPHMTVFKNMAFGLSLRKYPKAEIRERVEDAARTLGIEELLERKPKALSGGQRQRVAVGRAIVRQPAVFLFDEPLSNLDAKFRVQMRAEISKLQAQLQTTMIYVTHDQVEAMTMGDRIVVMLDGEVQQVDKPTELYHNPVNKFVASFIGSPPMNFMEGSLISENSTLYFKNGDVQLKVAPEHQPTLEARDKQDVILGLRPEAFVENSAQTVRQGESINTTVDVVEPMGAETYLYLNTENTTLTARIHSDSPPSINEAHVIDVSMSKAHFFDSETEATLL